MISTVSKIRPCSGQVSWCSESESISAILTSSLDSMEVELLCTTCVAASMVKMRYQDKCESKGVAVSYQVAEPIFHIAMGLVLFAR